MNQSTALHVSPLLVGATAAYLLRNALPTAGTVAAGVVLVLLHEAFDAPVAKALANLA